MLALITYKCIHHFYGRIVIISYRRELLFYYCCTGFARASEQIIDTPAPFLCPFIIIRGGVPPFVKLIVRRFFTLFYKQLILRL